MDRPALPGLNAAIMDKAYDSDMWRVLQEQGVEAVIPSKMNRFDAIANEREQSPCRQQGAR